MIAMSTMILFCGASALIVPHPPHHFASAEQTLLMAIAHTESNGMKLAIGKKGERGLYQFTKDTWEFYTNAPFDKAFNPEVASRVAQLHLMWLTKQFQDAKHPATPRDIYIAWNTGFASYKRRGFNQTRISKQAKQNLARFDYAYRTIYERN